MKLSENALKELNTNKVIAALVEATDKSYSTVKRWIEHDNDKIIDSRKCIDVLKEKTGMTEEQIFDLPVKA